ncbi:MAG: glutamate racemase [Clostridia bacterium]|nr:glutamate racemase [Clostridia bacterium]
MNKTVGIFDSGLGGLTAAAEFEKLFCGKRYIYFGDTARVPYGTKSADTICRYAFQDTRFLVDKGASLIIVACGTVSANAIDELKRHFALPIIGVVDPAAKRAAEVALAGKGRVTVLGTSATVKSGAYERAIHKIDKSIEVRSVACPMFVPLVENGYTKGEAAMLFAKEYLEPTLDFSADAVILGCTHYPHLSGVIGTVLEGSILVNSGKEAALAAAEYITVDETEKGEPDFYVSDAPESFTRLAKVFLGRDGVERAKCVDIESY